MLVPSKKHMYTRKWNALGQRCLSTRLLISFENGQNHLLTLDWKINEKKTPKTWFEISSERVLVTNDFNKVKTEDLQTIDPQTVHNQEAKDIISYSSLLPSESLMNILTMSGIIDKCNPVEGMEIVKKHISNVEKWYKKNKIDQIDQTILEWLEEQKTIGVQRIPVHHSLFSSNMDISGCKFFR